MVVMVVGVMVLTGKLVVVSCGCAHLTLLLEGVQNAHEEESYNDEKDEVEGNEPPDVLLDFAFAALPGECLGNSVTDKAGVILSISREEAVVDGVDECQDESHEVRVEQVGAPWAVFFDQADDEKYGQDTVDGRANPVFNTNCCNHVEHVQHCESDHNNENWDTAAAIMRLAIIALAYAAHFSFSFFKFIIIFKR